MNSKIILFLVLFAPTTVFSSDILFNRLSKLYAKDQNKCLVAAQRFIKYFPENSVSYYFASKVYFDKSKTAHNHRIEYSLLKKSINYAKKFERFDVDNTSDKVDWDGLKGEMEERIIALSDNLSREDQQSLSANLIIVFSELENVEIAEVDNEISPTHLTEELVVMDGSGFNGMPTGLERVSSANHEDELELLKYINNERSKRGMKPLIWEDRLANASRYHACDLATQNYFNHSTYDRKNNKLVRVGDSFDRIEKFYNETLVNAENIAAGNSSAQATYQQWYTSKGHNENMFNSESRLVGIGLYYSPDAPFNYYWVFCTAL